MKRVYSNRRMTMNQIKLIKAKLNNELLLSSDEATKLKNEMKALINKKHDYVEIDVEAGKSKLQVEEEVARAGEDADVITKISESMQENWHKENGLIAQEIESIPSLKHLVIKNEEGIRCVNYNGMIPVLLQAIKELNAKVDKQSKEIKKLKKAGSK